MSTASLIIAAASMALGAALAYWAGSSDRKELAELWRQYEETTALLENELATARRNLDRARSGAEEAERERDAAIREAGKIPVIEGEDFRRIFEGSEEEPGETLRIHARPDGYYVEGHCLSKCMTAEELIDFLGGWVAVWSPLQDVKAKLKGE